MFAAAGAAYGAQIKTMAGAYESAGVCAEPEVRDVCICNQYSSTKGGFLCSACKDNGDPNQPIVNRWGYGCAMACSDMCMYGCDFEGNCLDQDGKTELCPANCKRNSRDRSVFTRMMPSKGEACLNTFGHCEACQKQWSGLRCDKPCPANCGLSPEGYCDRAQMCYKCKRGFWGDQCDQDCPEACPTCQMRQGLTHGELVGAGECIQPCEGKGTNGKGQWGKQCMQECPDNCMNKRLDIKGNWETIKFGAPFCEKGKGHCYRCQDDKWWQDQCDQACPEGCKTNTCEQESGNCKCPLVQKGEQVYQLTKCDQGAGGSANGACNKNFWGPQCGQDCPRNTDLTKGGCRQSDGRPEFCKAGYFPSVNDKTQRGTCETCPQTCTNAECNADGKCASCEESYWGPKCENRCNPGCTAACSQKEGDCLGCKGGFTGAKCDKKCHHRCVECLQYENQGSKTPGNTPMLCTKCPLNEPSMLDKSDPNYAGKKAAPCKCIADAYCNGALPENDPATGEPLRGVGKGPCPGDAGTPGCQCVNPSGADKDDRTKEFVTQPAKKCLYPCKRGSTESYNEKDVSMCIKKRWVKAIFTTDVDALPAGAAAHCKVGEVKLTSKSRRTGKTSELCIEKSYVTYLSGS